MGPWTSADRVGNSIGRHTAIRKTRTPVGLPNRPNLAFRRSWRTARSRSRESPICVLGEDEGEHGKCVKVRCSEKRRAGPFRCRASATPLRNVLVVRMYHITNSKLSSGDQTILMIEQEIEDHFQQSHRSTITEGECESPTPGGVLGRTGCSFVPRNLLPCV